MIKRFFGVMIFLSVVSVWAQKNEVKPAVNASVQVPSKEAAAVNSAADTVKSSNADSAVRAESPLQSSKSDSAAHISSLSPADSAKQSDGNNDKDDSDSSGAASATLKVSTEPSEAALKIGDRDYGLTPVTITDLNAGEHTLELSKSGHFRRRVTIQLDSAGADLHFELLRPASIIITSEPTGAAVNFDGKPSGVTPSKSERMRPGDYPLSLSIDGYKPHEATVSLSSGASDSLHVTLEPIPPEDLKPQTQTDDTQHSSQPKKSLFNKEYTKAGAVAVVFAVFLAVLIGVEKSSY